MSFLPAGMGFTSGSSSLWLKTYLVDEVHVTIDESIDDAQIKEMMRSRHGSITGNRG